MPNYKIIGTDLKEYGPVSAEQIRQWIMEGRVDSRTKLQAEDGGEWKRLSDVPELAAPLVPGAGPFTCPHCGETFEDGFDSCWKCGTGKDGSPPKETRPFEEGTREAGDQRDETCPKCGSRNVRWGKLLPSGESRSVIFRPQGTRFFNFLFVNGVMLSSNHSLACLDCGLVWDYLPPSELKEFIAKYC
jgi:GYF domain 2